MSFLKNANPTGAIADFVEVYRQAGTNRLWIGLTAGLCTLGVFSVMMTQSWKGKRPLPEVTYINSWPENRTEEETRAFIAENQKQKEDLAKAQADAEREQQELWMALGRASGMDVDAMKKKADAEKAAEKAKAEAAAAKAKENAAKAQVGR